MYSLPKKEPFGLVGIEAYSYGKPVLVLKDSGGLKEIIEPIEPENIVENVKELALRLFYYENRIEIVNKSNIRKSYVENNFSIDRMRKDYHRVYLRFLAINPYGPNEKTMIKVLWVSPNLNYYKYKFLNWLNSLNKLI